MYKWALDKCALIELAILSLELIPFTSDQKYYNQKQGLYIHRCTNFSMFCRNLYSKSERKSYLYNVKHLSSMVHKLTVNFQ